MDPIGWNIVVAGAWNRAILTPGWVAETVFELPRGSPVEVVVAVDAFIPFQVRHDGLGITTASGRLTLEIDTPSVPNLARALQAVHRTIVALPRTPIRACGINIRYSAPEVPQRLIANTRCPSESLLPESGRELKMRRRGESVAFQEGMLNIIADLPVAGPCELKFNFDRQCVTHEDALGWLGKGAPAFTEEAERVLQLLTAEEETNAARNQ